MQRRIFVKNSVLTALALPFAGVIKANSDAADYSFLKLNLHPSSLQFDFFSIDSLGKNNVNENIILNESEVQTVRLLQQRNISSYFIRSQSENENAIWNVKTEKKSFTITSVYNKNFQAPFILNFSQHANHATLLGLMKDDSNAVETPAVLHFPDMGTLRLTCDLRQKVFYSSKRFIDHPFIKIELPAATEEQHHVEYHFEVAAIHPEIKDLDDVSYDCIKKNFISIFQLNPFLKILANNSASDACAFTLFEYAEVAKYTPPLAENLSAMALVKMTLDRYLNGTKGYGMLGYDYDKTWNISESASTCNTLDTYPSLLITVCDYILYSNDKKWFDENHDKIKTWINKMLAADLDNDGLLEFCLSGNSGSWKGDSSMRPANWWDTIGFGHKDAYSNALAYYALNLLTGVYENFDLKDEAEKYKSKAEKMKNIYTKIFLNNETGILAGWKSTDGKLHDYWFTFVNAMAICYGLVEIPLANSIMDKMLAKMKEVGFTNFELGLPGNLIPVIRADYTDLKPEVGGGKREDNLDGFEIYENGGATACYTYYTIRALQKLNRKNDADMILKPLLKSMSSGGFQGRCADSGRTKDWKTWSGECWGYEGFLVDNYMFLLCLAEH